MTVFIDSDVLIEVLRGQNQEVLSMWHSLADSDAALLFSPITAAEIWAGARADEHLRIMQLFRPLLCTPIDCDTAKQAGEYLRKFTHGHDLKIADALIAAAATRHHAALWTRGRKRYPMRELSFYA
jgi:predicted nucleic acid-binding protein